MIKFMLNYSYIVHFYVLITHGILSQVTLQLDFVKLQYISGFYTDLLYK